MSAENEDVKNKQFEDETEKENVAEDVAQKSVESGEAEASDGEAKAAQDEGRDKLEKDFAKLKDDYIRLYAEMDNMKKRAHQENEKTIKFAVSSFAKELLGVADNLERAITAMSGNAESCAELLKGVELTQNELTKVFEKFGIKRFNHIGEKFDPNFERVVQEIEDVVQEIEDKKAKSGVILAELQAGYTIHDRILREAMVIVAK